MTEYVISANLQAQIRAIQKLDGTAKKAVFEIAWRMKQIADSPDFAQSGYENIVDFAADNFGYARSTTLNYIKIARNYLTMNDKKQIRTICIHDDGKTQPKDYAIGQLNALGKTPPADFEMLDKEGVINPEMSADKIKKAIKEYFYQDEPEPKDDGDGEPENDNEPIEQRPEFDVVRAKTFLQPFIDAFTADKDYNFMCGVIYGLNQVAKLTGFGFTSYEENRDGDRFSLNITDIAADAVKYVTVANVKTKPAFSWFDR